MKRLRSNRPIGLERNNTCPHCNRKVKVTRYILPSVEANLAGYYVEHWWTEAICENFYKLSSGESVTLSELEKQDIK